MTALDRLLSKVERSPTGCWLWTGYANSGGYGKIWMEGGCKNAHRVSYELAKGPIPDGLPLDHLCRVRNCVNPDHLEPVSHRENVLRGEGSAAKRAAQTSCVNGHPFTEENIKYHGHHRTCRACARIHKANYKAKIRATKAKGLTDEAVVVQAEAVVGED